MNHIAKVVNRNVSAQLFRSVCWPSCMWISSDLESCQSADMPSQASLEAQSGVEEGVQALTCFPPFLQNTVNGITYKNDPAIFAWDLMNEGTDTITWQGICYPAIPVQHLFASASLQHGGGICA